jgi:hypothetical protein
VGKEKKTNGWWSCIGQVGKERKKRNKSLEKKRKEKKEINK